MFDFSQTPPRWVPDGSKRDRSDVHPVPFMMTLADFTDDEKRKLYPFAYMLACMDGNAFPNIIEQYIPVADEILQRNGGMPIVPSEETGPYDPRTGIRTDTTPMITRNPGVDCSPNASSRGSTRSVTNGPVGGPGACYDLPISIPNATISVGIKGAR